MDDQGEDTALSLYHHFSLPSMASHISHYSKQAGKQHDSKEDQVLRARASCTICWQFQVPAATSWMERLVNCIVCWVRYTNRTCRREECFVVASPFIVSLSLLDNYCMNQIHSFIYQRSNIHPTLATGIEAFFWAILGLTATFKCCPVFSSCQSHAASSGSKRRSRTIFEKVAGDGWRRRKCRQGKCFWSREKHFSFWTWMGDRDRGM